MLGDMGLAVLGLLCLAVQDADQDRGIGLSVDALGWYVLPSGWLSITRGSRPGTATQADLESDMNLDPGTQPEIEARWEFLDSHSIAVRAALLDLSGTGVTDEGFIYHGIPFGAGRSVRSELDFTLVQVDYQYAPIRSSDLRLSLHLGAEYWKFSGRIQTDDAQPPLDTQRSFDSAFWMAGVDVDWRILPPLDLQLRLLGGAERSEQYFYDLDARAQWNLGTAVGLTLGYRYQVLRFRQSTNQSDLRFQGPEFGLELRF